MKAFLEEYGLVIVVIIVIAVLISLAVYFGKTGKTNVEETYTNFSNSADKIVETSLSQAQTTVNDQNN